MARLRLLPVVAFLALLVVQPASAAGGSYVFDGGTPAQRAQVKAALDASAFDWSIVPAQVTIHVARGVESRAARGQIWLDSDLLSAGRFAWGAVQHEYAHQVDFFLLTPAERAQLNAALGGRVWCYSATPLAHARYGCERFASTLAWSYWPDRASSMRPRASADESAAMAPPAFRALLSRVLGVSEAVSLRRH
jgi:hypothetical protein